MQFSFTIKEVVGLLDVKSYFKRGTLQNNNVFRIIHVCSISVHLKDRYQYLLPLDIFVVYLIFIQKTNKK